MNRVNSHNVAFPIPSEAPTLGFKNKAKADANVNSTALAIRIAEPYVVLRGGADRPRRRRHDRGPGPSAVQPSTLGNSSSRARSPSPARQNSQSTTAWQDPAGDQTEAHGHGHGEEGGGHPADTDPIVPNNREDEFPPAILRGLLTLNVVKPIRVRKIDLRISGICRTEWPEGIGPRRLEISEETAVLDQSFTYFDALKDSAARRRAASVVPAGSTTADGEGCVNPPSRAASVVPPRLDSQGMAYYGSRDARLHHNDLDRIQTNGSVDQNGDLRPGRWDTVPGNASSPNVSRQGSLRESSRPRTPHEVYGSTTPAAGSSADSLGPQSSPTSPTSPSGLQPPLTNTSLSQSQASARNPSRDGAASRSKTPTRPKMRALNSDDSQLASGGRFKLSSIGDAIRGKSKARDASTDTKRRPSDADTITPNDRSMSRGRKKGLKALRDALTVGMSELGKIDADSDEDEDVHHKDPKNPGWREFKPGTYSWAIVIPLSTRLPPTVNCGFGTTTYKLKATVRRPGALTSNLVTETDIELVAAPGDDDTEESESIVVERMWETQLSYLIAVNQKSFPVGGSVPVTIRLRPLAKIKVYRISVFLEEKVVYFALQRKLQRSENVRRITLAKMQNEDDDKPLLPILSEAPDAIASSPLAPWLINPTSSDDSTPNCLDPIGPWDLEAVLKLPGPESRLKFTTTNAKSSIHITHVLKVVVRVDRGDDEFLDAKGKRKKWDIIVEATVHLLSHRCGQTLLPPYTQNGPAAPALTPTPGAPTPLARPARRDALSGYDPAAALALTTQTSAASQNSHELQSLRLGSQISSEHDMSPDRSRSAAPPPTYEFTLSHPENSRRPAVSAQVLSTRNSTDSEDSSFSHESHGRRQRDGTGRH